MRNELAHPWRQAAIALIARESNVGLATPICNVMDYFA